MVFKPACVCHQTTGEMLIKHREPQQHGLNVFYCPKETDAESISKPGLLNEGNFICVWKLLDSSKGLVKNRA